MFSFTEASKSPEDSSATAFLFQLLVVIFSVWKIEVFGNIEFFEEEFFSLFQRNNFSRSGNTKLTISLHVFYLYAHFHHQLFLTSKVLGITKIGFVHQKVLMIEIISVPRQKKGYQNS